MLNMRDTFINQVAYMPTLGFRFDTDAQKKELNDFFAGLVADNGELSKRGEALQYLVDQYKLDFKSIRYREAPESVEALIREADCQYLKYEPYLLGIVKGEERYLTGFVCYEFFSRKKKPDLLGSDHTLLLSKCDLCKAGKLDRIELKVQEQLRKKNIKGLLDLRDILINLQIEGGLAQIYICKANLLEKKTLILCTNGVHLTCPLEEGSPEVQVKKHCYNQITPWTQEPPCQFLIDPFIMVRIPPSEEAETIIEAIALEYRESGEGQEEGQPIKEVEAVVIETPEEPPEKPKAKKKKKKKKKEKK